MASRSTQRENLLRGITQKDSKQAMRRLFKQGWEAEVTGSTHVLFTHPATGARFQTALTSGNRNAGKYLLRDARVALKMAKEKKRRG